MHQTPTHNNMFNNHTYTSTCFLVTDWHCATWFAPHFVLTGMNPRWNIDLLLSDKAHETPSVHQYTTELLGRQYKVNSLVREHLGQAAESASRWYHRRVKPETFQVGELVLVFNPRKFVGRTPKWTLHFRETSRVEKRLNDATYVVRFTNCSSTCVCQGDAAEENLALPVRGVPLTTKLTSTRGKHQACVPTSSMPSPHVEPGDGGRCGPHSPHAARGIRARECALPAP